MLICSRVLGWSLIVGACITALVALLRPPEIMVKFFAFQRTHAFSANEAFQPYLMVYAVAICVCLLMFTLGIVLLRINKKN